MRYENSSGGTKIADPEIGLLDALRRFNAKERFYLVGYFLGNRDFKPTKEALEVLENLLGIPSGSDVFCAMDYHIDWLYGALQWYISDRKEGDMEKNEQNEKLIKGNQQDIDLLLAIDEHSKRYHIVMIEAKVAMPFSKSQIEEKFSRIKDIFNRNRYPKIIKGIDVHFMLIVHGKLTEKIEKWLKENDFELQNSSIKLLNNEELYMITRKNPEGNDWKNWEIIPRRPKISAPSWCAVRKLSLEP
ncbi:MAG: hypothetical protein ACHQ2F_03390 [Desulfobaccales bacterium]